MGIAECWCYPGANVFKEFVKSLIDSGVTSGLEKISRKIFFIQLRKGREKKN